MKRFMARGAKVAVASSVKLEKVSERLVGERGLVVVWKVIRTGELVEQRYVRTREKWMRYEDWIEMREGQTALLAPPAEPVQVAGYIRTHQDTRGVWQWAPAA
jgi:hypothetical protein